MQSQLVSDNERTGPHSHDRVNWHAEIERAEREFLKPADINNRYSPYLIDWRFLPEWARIVKDVIRPHHVRLNLDMAQNRIMAPLWHVTIGRGTRRSVEAAGILFIHVPKNGGTSISQRLYGRNLPHYTAAFYAAVFPDLAATKPSFAVLRHPVERLKSSYRFIQAGGTGLMAASSYAKLITSRAGNFDAFVNILFKHPDRIGLFESATQQMCYISQGGRILVDHLFTLDKRDGLSQQLSDLIRVRSLPHLNATNRTDVPMSRETEEKIGLLYRDDIALFERVRQQGGSAMTVKGQSLTLDDDGVSAAGPTMRSI